MEINLPSCSSTEWIRSIWYGQGILLQYIVCVLMMYVVWCHYSLVSSLSKSYIGFSTPKTLLPVDPNVTSRVLIWTLQSLLEESSETHSLHYHLQHLVVREQIGWTSDEYYYNHFKWYIFYLTSITVEMCFQLDRKLYFQWFIIKSNKSVNYIWCWLLGLSLRKSFSFVPEGKFRTPLMILLL